MKFNEYIFAVALVFTTHTSNCSFLEPTPVGRVIHTVPYLKYNALIMINGLIVTFTIVLYCTVV